jgi:hypothetical protein
VEFVVDKVALGQVFPRVLQFSPVSIIPPVLLYNAKAENTSSIIFITGLHNKFQCCGASVASAAGSFNKKTPEKGGRICPRNILYYISVRTMEKVQKIDEFKRRTPLSEPYRVVTILKSDSPC